MMIQYRVLILLFILSYQLTGCSDTDVLFEEVDLIEPEKMASFEDHPEFSQFSLSCGDYGLYAIDGRTNRVHQIDYETLQPVRSTGRQGRGPGEFNGIYLSDTHDGKLYISDAGNQGIHVLNEQTLEYEELIPGRLSGTRFSVEAGYLYSPVRHGEKESILQKINLDDHTVQNFGERTAPIFPGRNHFHALSDGHRVYALSFTEPVIKIYTLDGEMLTSLNFEHEPILSGTLQFADRSYREPGNENRSVILFQDAALFQDHLIVNVIDHQEGSHGRAAKYNNYMLFRITGDSLEKAGAFRTDIGERGVTRTFCMNGRRLYSNGGRDGLGIFEFDLAGFM